MCGRFTLTADLAYLMERFSIMYETGFDYTPSYNIAPSQEVLAVVRGEKGNKLGKLRWGLVPHWAKSADIGSKMINARSETAAEKPSFKKSLQSKRCLIPADSFYEWKQGEKGKIPQRIMLKSKDIYAFAGLWSMWKNGDEVLSTCTILTTAANDLIQDVHHRMPVILKKKDEDRWLNPVTPMDEVNSLLAGFNSGQMTYYPVSKAVNTPANNDPSLIEREEAE